MITKIPDNVKQSIINGVKDKFNTNIDTDIIEFLQDFQSKCAVEEGFAKKETVRFFNLAVFKYSERKIDGKNIMSRLLAKHNGDRKLAKEEFKELNEEFGIRNKKEKQEMKANKVVKPKRHDKVKSINSMFTAR